MVATILEQFVEEADINRTERALQERRGNLTHQRNQEIITLGTMAIESGFNRGNMVKQVWETVSRHRSLMRIIGFDDVNKPDDNRGFDIRSKRVNVSSGIGIVLRQIDKYSGEDFWTRADSLGVDAALDDHASPRTSGVTAVELKTGIEVSTNLLNPDKASSPDPEFWDKWKDSMFPFRGKDFMSSHDRENVTMLFYEEPTDDNKLIIAAGYNARFNNLLNVIGLFLPT